MRVLSPVYLNLRYRLKSLNLPSFLHYVYAQLRFKLISPSYLRLDFSQ
jgi:hypothetical protein